MKKSTITTSICYSRAVDAQLAALSELFGCENRSSLVSDCITAVFGAVNHEPILSSMRAKRGNGGITA